VKTEKWFVTLERAGLVPLLPGIRPVGCTFCGVQDFPGQRPMRLWNIAQAVDLFLPVGSTFSEKTILENGYYPFDLSKRVQLPFRRIIKPVAKRRKPRKANDKNTSGGTNGERQARLPRRNQRRGARVVSGKDSGRQTATGVALHKV
jgi:hypothetical protein